MIPLKGILIMYPTGISVLVKISLEDILIILRVAKMGIKSNDCAMNVVKRAIKEVGGVSELQHELAKMDIKVSTTTLYEMERRDDLERVSPAVVTGCTVLSGDDGTQLIKEWVKTYLKRI